MVSRLAVALVAMPLALAALPVLASAPPVKKSESGICHDTKSPWYARTTKFTPYPSMEACLASGGRKPK